MTVDLTVWFLNIFLVWMEPVVREWTRRIFTKSVIVVRHTTRQLPFEGFKTLSDYFECLRWIKKKFLNLKRNFFVITIRDKQYVTLLFLSVYICIVKLFKMSLLVIKNYRNVFLVSTYKDYTTVAKVATANIGLLELNYETITIYGIVSFTLAYLLVSNLILLEGLEPSQINRRKSKSHQNNGFLQLFVRVT